jgi:uncharacterized membrane protein YdjX (TVP38/TMEM64 family)
MALSDDHPKNAAMAEPSPRSPSFSRLIPLCLLLLAAAVFVLSGGRHYLTFAALAENRELLAAFVARNAAVAALSFILVYAGLTALSVPAAMLMTLSSGFLFGPWLGAFYALVAATLGASAVFLAARAGLAGLAERAGPSVQRLQAGFREDAFSYLLCFRLIPIFPFWLVNLVAGASGMKTSIYVTATFFGMVPGALVYACLGHGVGDLIAAGRHPDHYMIFRPTILLPLLGLAVLALLPVAYKRWKTHRREPAE